MGLICPIYCQNAQRALPLGQSETRVKYEVTDVVSFTACRKLNQLCAHILAYIYKQWVI